MHDQHPAGPVHVLRKDSSRLEPATACGLRPSGLVYNVHGGPTSCPDCLEALAAEVERALVPVLHRFRSVYTGTGGDDFRTYCGKLVGEDGLARSNGAWTCRACDIAYRRTTRV